MKTSSRWAVVAAATIALSSWAGMTPVSAGIAVAPVVDPSSVAPGGTFTVSGGYCDGLVTVTIAGLNLSDQVDGGTPPWQVSFKAPIDAASGPYTVVSSCTYFDFPDTIVTVTGEATTTSTTSTAIAPTTTAVAAKPATVNAKPAYTG